MPKLVIIESPYAPPGELVQHSDPWMRWLAENIAYAQMAMCDALNRGEAPFASHLLYTQPGILNDTIPGQRAMGIEAGLAWGEHADLVAVYQDRGISAGMWLGIKTAKKRGTLIEERNIPGYRA